MTPDQRRTLRRLAWTRLIEPRGHKALAALALSGFAIAASPRAPTATDVEWRITAEGYEALTGRLATEAAA